MKIYIEHRIESEKDLLKVEGDYFVIIKSTHEKDLYHFNHFNVPELIENQKEFWLNTFNSYLEEREIPEWDTIEKEFKFRYGDNPLNKRILIWSKSKLNLFI